MNSSAQDRGCDYCGLPVAGVAFDALPRYCCFGCRFAASITGAAGADGQARLIMTRLGIAIFFTMNVMVFTMLLWSQPPAVPGAVEEPAAAAFYGLARHACLLFTAPVILLLGGPLAGDALDELRQGRPSLNLLLLAGVVTAFIQSAWATWIGSGHVYFEVSCMVLVAVTLGKWLEASGKIRTTAALRDLRALLPDRVRRRAPGEPTTAEREIALAALRVGDVVRILPGEHIPVDGTITAGVASIDEQMVTGESLPSCKSVGDAVYSGTSNLDGELLVTVTAAPGSGTLETLIDTVTAGIGASRQQRLADRMAAWFLPLVLLAAVAACIANWRLSGPTAGVLAGLAVVVISCPCALGLATPMALWAAAGTATRRHVLIRDGDALSRLASADIYCFDKTGTLTTGCHVTRIEPAAGFADTSPLLAVAAGLARGSTHAMAAAILAAARTQGQSPLEATASRTIPGCGVEGRLDDGSIARIGSSRWIAVTTGARTADPTVTPQDSPQCLVAIDNRLLGGIHVGETIRPEAAAAVSSLRAGGARTIVLSGDLAPRAAAVAAELGMEWHAPLLPAEKLAFTRSLSRDGHRVVMVGDGLNDAPALAAADVGVALGCGADISRWSAHICLLRDDLAALPWIRDLAKRTIRTIRWNMVWAFGYNAACLPLAAAGWVHPAIAAAAMVASSLFVVSNSLSLSTEAGG